jgi:N-acetylmuramic acid 6-phosphate etherase
VAAVTELIPALARLVDDAVDRIRDGGRVHYFGAGTSGRLGVLDAAELPPTFGVSADLFVAHLAGGDGAIVNAVEGAEDSERDGRRIARDSVGPRDLAVGLTVSGTTPFVRGALAGAREHGAATALVTSNLQTPLAPLADHLLVAETGPEVLTGSTRLKAGTATKLVLNGFSTAVMVRLGRTYSNLMVSVRPTNQKLRERTLRILAEVTGAPEEVNVALLGQSGNDLAVAVVAAAAGVAPTAARAALRASHGAVGAAIDALSTGG